MDLRVFFYRKFVVGQGREKGIAREFLEKIKNRDPILRMCRGREVGKKVPALLYRECRGEQCSPLQSFIKAERFTNSNSKLNVSKLYF